MAGPNRAFSAKKAHIFWSNYQHRPPHNHARFSPGCFLRPTRRIAAVRGSYIHIYQSSRAGQNDPSGGTFLWERYPFLVVRGYFAVTRGTPDLFVIYLPYTTIVPANEPVFFLLPHRPVIIVNTGDDFEASPGAPYMIFTEGTRGFRRVSVVRISAALSCLAGQIQCCSEVLKLHKNTCCCPSLTCPSRAIIIIANNNARRVITHVLVLKFVFFVLLIS